MTTLPPRTVIAKASDGLRFEAGPTSWSLPPLSFAIGSSTAIAPDHADPIVDPSSVIARIFATLVAPSFGVFELLGKNVYRLDLPERQRLRSQIGFVHGYGGLLSNRTVRENIALPIAVHGRLKGPEEDALVDLILADYRLDKVAGMRPHEMDGATRWRACLARATALHPKWLVLEGTGNWEMDHGRGIEWARLQERAKDQAVATVVCLPRRNPGFESWFLAQGGDVTLFQRVASLAPERAWS